eukprot:CAMPEP_0181362788 /NCGR_PEP_ID=MMETSP1106-20121128/8265_1 /TAXON_ID=81844 /ORGANISM="Mantoniella antarctica, Strain SL-175" /LENGTH=164 /DNA_ID=CAMNT_0023476909 /DNA_START=261 /DNA_END=752 /DNA_ORIENTATION=-
MSANEAGEGEEEDLTQVQTHHQGSMNMDGEVGVGEGEVHAGINYEQLVGEGEGQGNDELDAMEIGKPMMSREKNNRYTSSHTYVGITRRAPGDTRSNAARPWRAQVNHMGKAHRAPGNFETPQQAAEAYDDLVRQLSLTKERPVNFVKNEGETGFDRGVTKNSG